MDSIKEVCVHFYAELLFNQRSYLGSLGLLPLVPLAQLGFAVAFGVLLDTIIVRSILVPALVHEIGPKIWWPSKLSKS